MQHIYWGIAAPPWDVRPWTRSGEAQYRRPSPTSAQDDDPRERGGDAREEAAPDADQTGRSARDGG